MDKLDIIIQKLDSLESSVQVLVGKVNVLEGSVNVLVGKVNVLEGSVKSLEGRMQSLEAGQKELYAIVSAVRHRQDEFDAKLDNVAMDVNKLLGKYEGLTTQFAEFREETRNKFNHLERHDRAIEQDLDRTIERLDDYVANRI